jgi:peptidoglycan hydrolase-like protein with peptidoglycan-binding domain
MTRSSPLALALLLACSHGASSSGSAAAPPPQRPADQARETAVVQPSDLSAEQVRVVQRALTDRGFALDLTGTFDDRTQTALMDFQRARGLPATGNLNRPTVDALGVDPRDVMPVRGSDGDDARAPQRAGDGQQAPADEPSKPSW